MSSSDLTMMRLFDRIPDECAAYEYLEGLRWDGTPECPHCGNEDRCYFLNPANGTSRKTRTGAASQRRVWKCGACRKQFSVLTNTIMHGTKIPVRVWVFVIYEMCCNKNGMSAREVERRYGMAPRSAWFMTQRIREAMANGGLLESMRGVVIADETFIGGRDRNRHRSNRDAAITTATEPTLVEPGTREKRHTGAGKRAKVSVLTLVNRETGEARSRIVPDVTGKTLRKAIAEQVDLPATELWTDDFKSYRMVAAEMLGHETVNHSKDEYVRYVGGRAITTNAVEGFFSQLKRSLDGTHHHVSRKHLHRYLAEFDYRYTTREDSDTQRMAALVGRVGGRRLTYRPLTSDRPASA